MNDTDLLNLGLAYTYKQAGYSDDQAIKLAAKVNFSKILKGFDDLTHPNLPVVRGNTLPATTPYKPNFVTGPLTPDPKKVMIKEKGRLLLEAKKGPATPPPLPGSKKLTPKELAEAAGGAAAATGVTAGAKHLFSKFKVEAKPGLPLKPTALEADTMAGVKPQASKAKDMIKSIPQSKLTLGAGIGGAAGLAGGLLAGKGEQEGEAPEDKASRERKNLLRTGAMTVGGAGAGLGLAKLMEYLKAKG